MVFKSFEDIIAWQKAQNLALEIYTAFSKQKDFGFRDQICRSSVEKSMLFLAERLSYLTNNKKNDLINSCDEVSKIIRGLIKSLQLK
jgi:hypothetical protein